MKFYYERDLKDFEFWGIAKENAATLDDREWKIVEKHLDEEKQNEWDIFVINALFRYEQNLDEIAQWLGYKTWRARLKGRYADWGDD